jgi:NAD(P)H dehydrogenase (quinone)
MKGLTYMENHESSQNSRGKKLFLVTGATGDTGRPTVKLLQEKGYRVRALARKEDQRAQDLRDLGAEVVVGDMLNLNDMRKALKGVTGGYFVFPLADGLVEASVVFAQAAKEEKLELIVNMSQKQSRPFAHSPATTKHWLTEQVFTWSGVPTVHLRVTFFAEWLLYIAHLIRQGRYVTPFDADSRFAPIPASDIARVIVGTLEHPEKHAGAAYQLHGPVEYSHQQIADVLSKTLNKPILFEQVPVPEFLKLLGMEADKAKQAHFEAVRIDQQEGLLAGTDSTGTEIIGQPLLTLQDFILANKGVLS